MFYSLSLGNIGESGAQCNSLNMASSEDNIQLSCPAGKFIGIEEYGLALDDKSKCVEVKDELKLIDVCKQFSLHVNGDDSALKSAFAVCKDK